MHLRRSHSAGCNKGKTLQEVTTKRDDDGTNDPFVLEATSLAPAGIRSNDNIAQGRRQISSSFARLRNTQTSKRKVIEVNKTVFDDATERQKNSIHFGRGMMNGVIRSKKLKEMGVADPLRKKTKMETIDLVTLQKKVEDLSKVLFLARKQHDLWVFVERLTKFIITYVMLCTIL